MPIQAPQWTDYLICPICIAEFDKNNRKPISLSCGHTICRLCLQNLHRKICPFDQNVINTDISLLPINYALLQLVTNEKVKHEYEVIDDKLVPSEYKNNFIQARKHIEELALFLKPINSNLCILSRPMQRKLVSLISCQLVEADGKSRALRCARSLGERTVTELILQHQNSQQLSANLWAAVRARGCQFLGPAMQEEVLKLVLLALEDGSALSRKVLVMFVVQRLEVVFPQASKTSIGHVVQLLYRASCFKVSKREGDSSLMQLKEEFRTYDALRREHDAQVVQIATEAGLRIAPDQWSALLYGDAAHKSHMQSIIDKLQTPLSFALSVQELIIALQRSGDPGRLGAMRTQFELLASIDAGTDAPPPSWPFLTSALEAAAHVVRGLVNFLQIHGVRRSGPDHNVSHVHGNSLPPKYKVSMCRDLSLRGSCPRGANCTFAHSTDELERYRARNHRKHSLIRPPMSVNQLNKDHLIHLDKNVSTVPNLNYTQQIDDQNRYAIFSAPLSPKHYLNTNTLSINRNNNNNHKTTLLNFHDSNNTINNNTTNSNKAAAIFSQFNARPTAPIFQAAPTPPIIPPLIAPTVNNRSEQQFFFLPPQNVFVRSDSILNGTDDDVEDELPGVGIGSAPGEESGIHGKFGPIEKCTVASSTNKPLLLGQTWNSQIGINDSNVVSSGPIQQPRNAKQVANGGLNSNGETTVPYEMKIVNDMRELELKWQKEFADQGMLIFWSSSDDDDPENK